MIVVSQNTFELKTENTSYIFTTGENNELLHLYYGAALSLESDGRQALLQKWSNQNGCSIVHDEAGNKRCPDDEKYEISAPGTGDVKTPMAALRYTDGGTTGDFRFESYEIKDIAEVAKTHEESGLPHTHTENGGEKNALVVTLKEKKTGVVMKLVYCVYEDCDCITRSCEVCGNGAPVTVEALYSLQLDLDADAVKVSSFHGDWGREMDKCDVMLSGGSFVSGSRTGNSSNHANPFVMYGEPCVCETSGECYATNLIYSGDHRESVEFGGHGKARILTGINPDFLGFTLSENETFTAPEAVMTYSSSGYRGVSKNIHAFVRSHVVRGNWQHKERPVLLNSWEAAYFKITEHKLLKLARAAKDVGIELFVVDDGWFGKRNDDTSSLGDWYDNKEKLPDGIGALSKKIKDMGLMFGIWVEPEMVNEESDLFRAHPDWAVRDAARTQALGRNQMILDLSKTEVQEYIIKTMSDVFERSHADYVKWDMNRNFSDRFSMGRDSEGQRRLPHSYILGLYRVMRELTKRFPDILFEGCASGGNRFDLGILSFFPQIWASDDTDAAERCRIQTGYSYGYPQSTWSAHVSASPNHQTLRSTPLETRFAVASMGVFGYELNLCDLSADELKEIETEVEIYKGIRRTMQFGDFYRLGGSVCADSFEGYTAGFLGSRLENALLRACVVSPDKKDAVGILVNGTVRANYSHTGFRFAGLDDKALYHMVNRPRKFDVRVMGDLVNTMAPIHIKQDSALHRMVARFVKLDGETEDYRVSGSLLNNAGVSLAQTFAGVGYGENTRIYKDFEARMYFATEERDTAG